MACILGGKRVCLHGGNKRLFMTEEEKDVVEGEGEEDYLRK